jgi:hypothetical protein
VVSGGDVRRVSHRAYTVPPGKAILFPIICAECSEAEGNGSTDGELRACADGLIDHVTVVEASVDGVAVQHLDSYRVQSPLFQFTLPPDNVLGLDPGTTPSVSDGFWVILAPLSVGEHTIHFHAVAPFPEFDFTFEVEVTYHLTVAP